MYVLYVHGLVRICGVRVACGSRVAKLAFARESRHESRPAPGGGAAVPRRARLSSLLTLSAVRVALLWKIARNSYSILKNTESFYETCVVRVSISSVLFAFHPFVRRRHARA